jgi:hypothetical protein
MRRKSFSGVEKRLFPVLLVENHSTTPSRRNPFFIVEKHVMGAISVEIHSTEAFRVVMFSFCSPMQ